MRFTLRDWISLLGFVSLASSLFTTTTPFASTRPAAATAPTQSVSSEGMSKGMKPPASLRINLDGRDIVTIFDNGNVAVADELTINEASRQFWQKVGELAPDFCRQQAAKHGD